MKRALFELAFGPFVLALGFYWVWMLSHDKPELPPLVGLLLAGSIAAGMSLIIAGVSNLQRKKARQS